MNDQRNDAFDRYAIAENLNRRMTAVGVYGDYHTKSQQRAFFAGFEAAGAPAPELTDGHVLSVLRAEGDGSFSKEDIACMRSTLQRHEELRVDIWTNFPGAREAVERATGGTPLLRAKKDAATDEDLNITRSNEAAAQDQLDALREEVARLTKERDELNDARNAAIERCNFMFSATRDAQDIAALANDRWAAVQAELAALKAQPTDIDALMVLADEYAAWKAAHEEHATSGSLSHMNAAREALRTRLASLAQPADLAVPFAWAASDPDPQPRLFNRKEEALRHLKDLGVPEHGNLTPLYTRPADPARDARSLASEQAEVVGKTQGEQK